MNAALWRLKKKPDCPGIKNIQVSRIGRLRTAHSVGHTTGEDLGYFHAQEVELFWLQVPPSRFHRTEQGAVSNDESRIVPENVSSSLQLVLSGSGPSHRQSTIVPQNRSPLTVALISVLKFP